MDVDGSGPGGEEQAPEGHQREINVLHFVKDRVAQIAELLEAVDNAALVSGEVTKGPRTALQRLPRHMRRRAMSYNVKRLPRSQRRFAASVIAASKHRKKPPSRFWRRRPRNLLKEYVRRQRKHVWLETHIWHAKRFHMIEKYGHKLAFRSFQRAFRPSYRDSMHHCTVHDVSFLRCFQIVTDNKELLIESLRPLVAPAVSATFAFKMALEGKFEMSALLYKPGEYPHGFIGPVRFMWSPQSASEWSLIIWSHPANSDILLESITKLLNLAKSEDDEVEDDAIAKIRKKPHPSSVSEWHLQNSASKHEVYKANQHQCKLLDLRDQLVRFRLYGPKSIAVLDSVLKVIESDALESWMKNFTENNAFWKGLKGRTSGEFPDGTVLTLLVADPRLSRPHRKQKPDDSGMRNRLSLNVAAFPTPQPEFWNVDIRKKVLETKISEEELQKRRRDNLASSKLTDSKIPVVLVVRSGGSGTTNTFSGVDVIVPAGFGMDFWLALQYGTARAVSLRDKRSIEFESNRLHFPLDVPDCKAGVADLNAETETLREKYLARPHNRRIKYWTGLSVKHPFRFAWNELVSNWKAAAVAGAVESEAKERAYVLRDRRCLASIGQWVRGKAPEPTEILNFHSTALVPICLNAQTTGRPLRLALLCVPKEEDLQVASTSKEDDKRKIEEPKRFTDAPKKMETEPAESSKSQDFEGFTALSGVRKETVISLNAMFPDKEILKKRKKTLMKKQKRQKAKAAKRRKQTQNDTMELGDGESTTAGTDSTETIEAAAYRDYCSRLTIGRIVRGDYSFSSGKGCGLGYCSLLALREIRNGKVLFRNTSSKYYHLGKISILKGQVDL